MPPRVVRMSRLGVSGPFRYSVMVPMPSPFHSVFRAIHGREANTKGTVTPLWMYKKLEKKKKKAICKAFLGCFSRVFKLFLDTRKNRAFKALLNCPGRLDNGTKQTYISICLLAVKQKAKTLQPQKPRGFWGFLFIKAFQNTLNRV